MTRYGESPWIYGMFDPGGEHWMEGSGTPGWIVFPEGVGDDPDNQHGRDYRRWADKGFGVIARLVNGWHGAGCIPDPWNWGRFAKRIGNFVAHSQGCHTWIIGNEMNHPQERPNKIPITPGGFASCFALVYQEIHSRPGHENDIVIPGAVAPWNAQTSYPSNPTGDWIAYWTDMLVAIYARNAGPDGLAFHFYTHGSDPALIRSYKELDTWPGRYLEGRTIEQFLAGVPADMRKLPCYIDEVGQNGAWANVQNGWIPEYYSYIWDLRRAGWDFRCGGALFCWERRQPYSFQGLHGIHSDFDAAMGKRYRWKAEEPPPLPPPPPPIGAHEYHCPYCGVRLEVRIAN